MSYIGQTLGQGKASRSNFTASGGETAVTVENGYQVGQLSVYLNGVKLVDTADFGATNGTTIAGLSPALVAGDIIEFVALDTFTAIDSVPASGGTFTGNVTFDSIHQGASKNITGTLTENALYLSNAFVMTGNITVSGKTTLAKITDDDTTTAFLTDTNGQTITGSGTLTLGVLV